jgi:tetratricopeptide (TPR) repeat protein
MESVRVFNGVLLTIFCAALIGVVAVIDVLPAFAHRVTHAVYDSAEMMEYDVMHDARSLVAQGDFLGAIEGFKKAATADPLNRLPWVEIVKIYKDNLHDSASAIQTIRDVLEAQEWELDDAAYFMFRLAELYDEFEKDHVSAVSIMNQVMEQFPGTRHAANASHKLHEWSEREAAREEAEYLAGLAAAEQAQQAEQAEQAEEEPVVDPPSPVDDGDESGRTA